MSIQPITIGFLGAGAIARALAGQFLRVGHTVILSNSRGPASLHNIVTPLGDQALAGTTADAAHADMTVLCVPWNRIAETVDPLPPWNGQIVIDATNPLWPPLYELADLNGKTSSEIVAAMLHGARVVKAFNTLPPTTLSQDPQVAQGRRVIFVSGDDPDANGAVAGLASSAGFAPVILGGLVEGGTMQQFPGGPLPTLNLLRVV